jgi:hypothetical protein
VGTRPGSSTIRHQSQKGRGGRYCFSSSGKRLHKVGVCPSNRSEVEPPPKPENNERAPSVGRWVSRKNFLESARRVVIDSLRLRGRTTTSLLKWRGPVPGDGVEVPVGVADMDFGVNHPSERRNWRILCLDLGAFGKSRDSRRPLREVRAAV